MKRLSKVIFGIGILLFGVATCALLWVTRPRAEKNEDSVVDPVVKVAGIEFRDHSFDLPSQGIVEPNRRTLLAAEVGGRVIVVSPDFEVGSRVRPENEEAPEPPLVTIDPTDYEAALAQARSTEAEARATLANEEARSEQALRDWRKLGRSGDPPDLVAREPQLESARERVKAAEAAVEKARQDLERTKIFAPYEAIVTNTFTELGNYLVPGAQVAEIYETGPYEVRLPLSIDEASFLETGPEGDWTGTARVSATVAGITRHWNARIIRSEGELDRETRSIHLVARIEEPEEAQGVEIRPGLFVQATIPSGVIPNLAAIPSTAFRVADNREQVVVVDGDDRIRFRDVTVVRRERDQVYVRGGFLDKDRACLTELPDLVEGIHVKIESGEASPEEKDLPASPTTTARN